MTQLMVQNYNGLDIIEMAEHRLMLEEFLVKDANLEVRDSSSRNTLYWAIHYRHKHNTRLLLKYNVSLMVTNELHALFHCIDRNDLDTFVLLLELENINIDMRNQKGQTLLMEAIQAESVMMVRYLMNLGADIYAKDDEDMMALDFAKNCTNKDVYNLIYYRIVYEASQKRV